MLKQLSRAEPDNRALKLKNPPRLMRVGSVVEIPVAESIPQNTPDRSAADSSSTDKMRE